MPSQSIQLSPALLLETLGDDWPAEQLDAVIELLAKRKGRFPAGSRRLPSGLVRAVQRQRLIVAMLDAAATLGYRETHVQDVIERAGVSRPTFYEHFDNKDDCFLGAVDAGARRLRSKITTAAADGDGWRQEVQHALAAVLAFAAAEPQTVRTLIVEARAATPEAARRRIELLDGLASCLDASARRHLDDSRTHSPLTAAGVVGGVEAVLYARLCDGRDEELKGLLPALVYFAVLPYEGQRAASEASGAVG